jgi:hypothetical protein
MKRIFLAQFVEPEEHWMTHRHRLSAFLVGSALISAALASCPAQAQTARFRVTPLVKLDFSANADGEGDCVVDINDILAVNAVYCADPCPDPVPDCCGGCQQCGGSSFGGGSGQDGPLSVEELITLILEAGIPEDTQAALIEQLLSL